MPGRGLLERFRPAAAPGAAGRVGIPTDSTEDVALLAVLGALQPTGVEAEGLRERARARAAAVRDDAEVRAAAVLARARLDAAEQRAAVAAQAREAGEREGRRLVDEAARTAEEMLATGRARVPALVHDLVDDVLSELLGSSATGEGPR